MILRKLTDDFLRVLGDAQKYRSVKSKLIGNEFEWVIYERAIMLQAVNAMRLQRGRSQIMVEEVRRVEAMAVGHVDYSRKFALYCAHLVSGA